MLKSLLLCLQLQLVRAVHLWLNNYKLSTMAMGPLCDD